jgi:hypothetical protein
MSDQQIVTIPRGDMRAFLGNLIGEAGLDPIMRSMAIAFVNLQSEAQLSALADIVETRVMPVLMGSDDKLAALRQILTELGAPDDLADMVMSYARRLAD